MVKGGSLVSLGEAGPGPQLPRSFHSSPDTVWFPVDFQENICAFTHSPGPQDPWCSGVGVSPVLDDDGFSLSSMV